jgi:5-methylcytosine-specific restriction protein A
VGKLSSLKPKLGTLRPRLGPALGSEKSRNAYRAAAQPWRAWYKTAEWKRLRQAVLLRDKWTCQRTGVLCIGKGNAPDAPVVNHKTPHRGNRALFFDINNLELVTKQVHDGLIQSEERRAAW